MFIHDVTETPVTRERAAELIACSLNLIDRHIARGVLRPVANAEDGAPRYSSKDCWDLYKGTPRGWELVYGPRAAS